MRFISCVFGLLGLFAFSSCGSPQGEFAPSLPVRDVPWYSIRQGDIQSGGGAVVSQESYSQVVPVCRNMPGASSCDLWLGMTTEGEMVVFTVPSLRGISLGRLPVVPDHIGVSSQSDMVVVTRRNLVQIYRLPDLKIVTTLERIPSDIQALDISADDNIALFGAADGRVYRWAWDVAAHPSGRTQGRFDVERYFAHTNVVSAVAFHPGGRVFFSGDWTGSIIAWKGYEQDPYGGKFDRNLFETGFFTEATAKRAVAGSEASRVESLAINQEGTRLFAAYESGDIDVWKMRGLKRIIRIKPHRGSILFFSVSADGNTIVSYGRDQQVVVSKLDGKFREALGEVQFQAREVFKEHHANIRSVSLFGDAQVLLGGEKGLTILPLSNLEGSQKKKTTGKL